MHDEGKSIFLPKSSLNKISITFWWQKVKQKATSQDVKAKVPSGF